MDPTEYYCWGGVGCDGKCEVCCLTPMGGRWPLKRCLKCDGKLTITEVNRGAVFCSPECEQATRAKGR